MFYKINNYLKGYILILIEGVFPERFINLATKNKIDLWDVRRKSNNSISAHVAIKDFKKIRKFAKNSNCKIHIIKKHGLKFFIYKHRKRKVLLSGFIIFFLILWTLTQFVWIIYITGNNKIPDKVILECASKAGLHTGMPVTAVDSDNIRDYLMTNMNELSYVSVTQNGTTVSIDIREREEKREHFDKNTPSNIIASQSGVIESVLVQSGTAAIKKGDVVYKGQLLVSGAADNKYLGIKYSNSDANILARVWHEKTVQLPYYTEQKIQTGRTKKYKTLKIFDFSINLFVKNKILFEKYDILSYTNYISLGEGKILPIGIETLSYNEYETRKTKLTEEQTKELLLSEFNNLYKNTEIISRSFKTKDNNLTIIFECIENIGQEEVLDDNREISGS